jgi:hypothetical protein
MKVHLLVAFTLFTLGGIAQTDSVIIKKQDTIKIGNMLIVGGNNDSSYNRDNRMNIVIDAKGKSSQKNGVTIYGVNDTLVAITDDTVKVGRIKIINKSEGSKSFGQKNWESLLDGDFKKTKISFERKPKKLKPITTNWWIFDLGFANYVDRTTNLDYSTMMGSSSSLSLSMVSSKDLKLNNVKSSNFNIWIVQQKASLYKNYWNLKYGIGLEMYNFRFQRPISFSNTPGNNIYIDDVNFTKNKLFVEYLTVPVQLNYHSKPDNNKSFYASLGVSAGYLIQSHTKQISEERGKRKVNGNFNLNNFKMATIGELGVGSLRLYGSYNLTNMFDKNLTHFDLTPFAIGVRFSKF